MNEVRLSKQMLRAIMGRPRETLEDPEKTEILDKLENIAPVRQSNNQRSWTDEYIFEGEEYHVHDLEGEVIVERLLPEELFEDEEPEKVDIIREIAVNIGLISNEYNGFDRTNLNPTEKKFAEAIVKECIYTLQLKIVRNGSTPENIRSREHIRDLAEKFGIELPMDYFGVKNVD